MDFQLFRSTLNSSRIYLEFNDTPLYGKMSIGWYNKVRAEEHLDTHRHPGMMEICYLAKGKQIYEVNGIPHLMKGNDIFLTFPNEAHSTARYPQEKGVLFWMQVKIPFDDQEDFLLLPGDLSAPLVNKLKNIRQRIFAGNNKVLTLFEETLMSWYFERVPFNNLMAMIKATELINEIVKCSSVIVVNGITDDISSVMKLIDDKITENFSIEYLADYCMLSVSRFKIKFKECTGLPPGEYIMRRKIDNAKNMLADNISVTKTAINLGFSSSQYFATVFKKFTGHKPGD